MAQENREIISNYLEDLRTVISKIPMHDVLQVVDVINEARENGKSIYIFGNGGSAATASHFACDLAKGAIRSNTRRIRALALTDMVPLLSAWANDSAYEFVFSEQVENYVEFGDIVIAISGSGNSLNVLNGVAAARAKGAITIGLTAFDGGHLKNMVDTAIVVPVFSMEQAEDIHLMLEHIITTCLREGASFTGNICKREASVVERI
ncbi:MAG: SIS domain-containing protein [Dehalococcoidales bacterium]|nr:SIS domain-containing protein [Dehalococcoidales bacterium]